MQNQKLKGEKMETVYVPKDTKQSDKQQPKGTIPTGLTPLPAARKSRQDEVDEQNHYVSHTGIKDTISEAHSSSKKIRFSSSKHDGAEVTSTKTIEAGQINSAMLVKNLENTTLGSHGTDSDPMNCDHLTESYGEELEPTSQKLTAEYLERLKEYGTITEAERLELIQVEGKTSVRNKPPLPTQKKKDADASESVSTIGNKNGQKTNSGLRGVNSKKQNLTNTVRTQKKVEKGKKGNRNSKESAEGATSRTPASST